VVEHPGLQHVPAVHRAVELECARLLRVVRERRGADQPEVAVRTDVVPVGIAVHGRDDLRVAVEQRERRRSPSRGAQGRVREDHDRSCAGRAQLPRQPAQLRRAHEAARAAAAADRVEDDSAHAADVECVVQ
jgi:hypothetical protein